MTKTKLVIHVLKTKIKQNNNNKKATNQTQKPKARTFFWYVFKIYFAHYSTWNQSLSVMILKSFSNTMSMCDQKQTLI